MAATEAALLESELEEVEEAAGGGAARAVLTALALAAEGLTDGECRRLASLAAPESSQAREEGAGEGGLRCRGPRHGFGCARARGVSGGGARAGRLSRASHRPAVRMHEPGLSRPLGA